jgi:hypothetical protein
MSAAVTHLFEEWEGAPANTYGADVVDIKCADGNVFVISDLHVGAGLSGDGVYDGLENFLADQAFDRFLDWAHHRSAGPSETPMPISGLRSWRAGRCTRNKRFRRHPGNVPSDSRRRRG